MNSLSDIYFNIQSRLFPMKEKEFAEVKTRRLEVQPERSIEENLADLRKAVIGVESKTVKEKPNTGVVTNYICY